MQSTPCTVMLALIVEPTVPLFPSNMHTSPTPGMLVARAPPEEVAQLIGPVAVQLVLALPPIQKKLATVQAPIR